MKIQKCSNAVSRIVNGEFYGSDITAVQTDDGRVWVSIRSVCDAIGVHLQTQLEKLRSDDYEWVTIRVIRTVAEDGKQRQLAMIDLESLPMWLVTIKPSKVAFEVREKLRAFKKEAKAVLAAWFQGSTKSLEEVVAASEEASHRLDQMELSIQALRDEIASTQFERDYFRDRSRVLLRPIGDTEALYVSFRAFCGMATVKTRLNTNYRGQSLVSISDELCSISADMNVEVRREPGGGRFNRKMFHEKVLVTWLVLTEYGAVEPEY